MKLELLTLLIEKWDEENNSFDDVDPITLLHWLMEERILKAKDLVEIFGVSKASFQIISIIKKDFQKKLFEASVTISKFHRRHLTDHIPILYS